jgi:hypothetical protein
MKRNPDKNVLSVVVPRDRISARGVGDRMLQKISVAKLRRSFSSLQATVSSIIAEKQADLGAFVLEEIELSVEIAASGELRVLGSGVAVEGTGGLTLTFRKQANSGG